MQASDIMSTRVVTIRNDASIAEAIRVMLQNHISGLPVVDAADKPVGIVTEGDFLRRAELGTETRRRKWLELLLGPGRMADEYVHTHGRKVAEIMTTDLVTVPENAAVEDVVQLMEKCRIKRVIVTRGDKIAGIVSRANLLHALARIAAEAKPMSATDQTIRAAIVAKLDELSWAPRASVNAIVRDGVVDLQGVILDERDRTALKVVAENIPGVRSVRDHLVWVEPNTGFTLEAPAENNGRAA